MELNYEFRNYENMFEIFLNLRLKAYAKYFVIFMQVEKLCN